MPKTLIQEKLKASVGSAENSIPGYEIYETGVEVASIFRQVEEGVPVA